MRSYLRTFSHAFRNRLVFQMRFGRLHNAVSTVSMIRIVRVSHALAGCSFRGPATAVAHYQNGGTLEIPIT